MIYEIIGGFQWLLLAHYNDITDAGNPHELFLHYQYNTVSAISRPQNLASILDGNIITRILYIVVRIFGHCRITPPSTIIAYHGFLAKSSTKLLIASFIIFDISNLHQRFLSYYKDTIDG